MIVGIVGAGQLAQMLALAGVPLGLRFVFLDPAPDACAASLGTHICAAFDDQDALAELAAQSDIVTYEFENIPADAIRLLTDRATVFPDPVALHYSQDRLREKTLFRELGIATPDFAAIDSLADLQKAAAEIGLPAVLKTRTLGYDGKGQAVLRGEADLAPAWEKLGGVPLILEQFIPFDREVSVIGARDPDGRIAFHPLAENTHREGILRLSLSRAGDAMQGAAEDCTRRLMEHMGYTGTLALELFQQGDKLIANEFAPRVHNSGHWTIEGAVASQFENHLRAGLGLPMGDPGAVGFAAMVNFIGAMPDTAALLSVPGLHLHSYGKDPRPGRKVGHATVCAGTADALAAALGSVLDLAKAAEAG
jgi:5-(carboxyamino)imidazole ribonucleotide synthase